MSPSSPRVALFAGSFDPITNGHLDVIGKAVKLADKLVLAIGIHPGKTPLFPADERLAMLNEICAPLGRAAGCEIACTTFADLVVTAAQRAGRDACWCAACATPPISTTRCRWPA